MIEKQNQGIHKDLSEIIKGDLLFTDIDRVLYSTDASLYKMKPEGIVIPEDIDDVVETVKYCQSHNIPITPRGSGSGLAGSAINKGIILDFVPKMNEILELNGKNKTVRVQPGAFQTFLNNELSRYDLFFPPNPSSADYCSIGGMVACNSSGGKSVKYGSTKKYVESLKLVLFNGDVVDTHIYKVDDPDFQKLLKEKSEWGRINREIFQLCSNFSEIIEEYTPNVAKNCSGYDLRETLRDGVFDINKVIVGSEGTLAIIVEALLKLAPVPVAKRSAMLFFETLEDGGRGIIEILKFKPSTCEIMAGDFIELVKKDRPEVADFMPDKAGTALLLEFEGFSDEDLTTQMENCVDHLKKMNLLLDVKIAESNEDQANLWSMRKAALPIIYNRPGLSSPITFVEDCTVHPEKLPFYIRGIFEIFEKHRVESTAYGHAGDGNIHTRPLLDLRKQEDVDKLEPIAKDVYELAHTLGATFSGEHGDGILRTMFLPDLFGPLYDVFLDLKKIMDPRSIMNPGKILNEKRSLFPEHQRMGGGNYKVHLTETRIDEEEVRHNLEKCHGCSQCRTFCPVVLASNKEKALPRAKNNLARSVIYGDLKGKEHLLSAEIKEILDLCYNCKTCLHQCPTQVDTGLVMQHLKNNYYEKKSHTIGETLISNASFLGKAAVAFNPLSNFMLKLKPVRSVMKTFIGLSSEIPLPAYAMKSLKHTASEKAVHGQDDKKIAFFTGCTAKYNDRDEGHAFIRIMEYLGYEVLVPDQKCCGLAKLGLGNYKGAEKSINYNTDQFLKVVNDGYTPVTTCPSCHFMMAEGAASVVNNESVEIVGEKFREATDFLYEILSSGDHKFNLKPINKKLAYKNACHAKETGSGTKKLLNMIPDLDVVAWYDQCCGMGGTFGMKSKHYEKASDIAVPMSEHLNSGGADIQSTSCGACAVQVENHTKQVAVHPLVLLGESLGV